MGTGPDSCFRALIVSLGKMGLELPTMSRAIGAGLESIKTNAVPMALLWAAALSLVTGYYHCPAVVSALEPLCRWQTQSGWIASFLNRFFFCGVLPGVFILALKSLQAPHPLAVILAQTLLSGICGIVSGWMFELHAVWFGTGTDWATVLIKTIVYQFGWVVVFFMPFGATVYFWIGRNFSLRRTRAEWPRHFVGELLLPNLIVNWTIWVPLSLIVHLFPTPLQTQLTGLANAFLSLVLLTLGRRAATGRSVQGKDATDGSRN